MAKWLLLWLAASALEAAVIRGVVVENQTGRPLARALVTVQPVAGTPGAAQSARTNLYGAFEFSPVAAGAYLVTASRRGFATLEYGQKRWKAAGVPIVVDESGTAALNLRLPRLGAITGWVVDENDVGLPEHEVMAYRNTRPPQLAAHAVSDDRGMYRLWGLEPGSYLVRTGPKKSDEDSYLPTFARETGRVEDARTVEVELDRQTDDVIVRPFPGRLSTVAGQAYATGQVPVTVTLVSDMGSVSAVTDTTGNFHFDSIAPGLYELNAQARSDRPVRVGVQAGGGVLVAGGLQAAFLPLVVDRERVDVRFNLGPLADLQVLVEDIQGQPLDLTLFQLRARRKELSGDGSPQNLRPNRGHVPLVPGRWDLALVPTSSYYVTKFSVAQSEPGQRGRADGWNEIAVASGPATVRFVLSPHPGAVRGAVTGAMSGTGREPVAGAPVYLEPYDAASRKRLGDARMARTDMQGKYGFYGLPPGDYRILATFEYQSPDSEAMDAAAAPMVKVEESRDAALDLVLYVAQ